MELLVTCDTGMATAAASLPATCVPCCAVLTRCLAPPSLPPQLRAMELRVLVATSFRVGMAPTIKNFQRCCINAYRQDQRHHWLSSFLCDLALMDADCSLRYLPSTMAAAAVFLAAATLEIQPPWNAVVARHGRRKVEDIEEAAGQLAAVHRGVRALGFEGAVYKFSTRTYLRVSGIAPISEARLAAVLKAWKSEG